MLAGAGLLGAGLFLLGAAALLAVRTGGISAEARHLSARLVALVQERPWWLAWLLIAVVPAVCEELLFRGWVLAGLAGRRRSASRVWAAVGIQAAAFAAFHLLPERMPQTFVLGLVLGGLVAISGSLLPAVVCHLTHNSMPLVILWLAGDVPDLAAAVEAGTPGGSPGLPGWAVAAAGLRITPDDRGRPASVVESEDPVDKSRGPVVRVSVWPCVGIHFGPLHHHPVSLGLGDDGPRPLSSQFAMVGEDEERRDVSRRVVAPRQHGVVPELVVGHTGAENRARDVGGQIMEWRRNRHVLRVQSELLEIRLPVSVGRLPAQPVDQHAGQLAPLAVPETADLSRIDVVSGRIALEMPDEADGKLVAVVAVPLGVSAHRIVEILLVNDRQVFERESLDQVHGVQGVVVLPALLVRGVIREDADIRAIRRIDDVVRVGGGGIRCGERLVELPRDRLSQGRGDVTVSEPRDIALDREARHQREVIGGERVGLAR
ncbi:CPBP family intramembrane metalloprotease, partial [bacterium]|nr:CPBP family intramembrane metalloprotease [bacterium]